MSFEHETVKHSISEYVNGMARTNGIESFWALLKRGYHGTYHHMSEKHLGRYVTEFSGRHNDRKRDTGDQMARIAHGYGREAAQVPRPDRQVGAREALAGTARNAFEHLSIVAEVFIHG